MATIKKEKAAQFFLENIGKNKPLPKGKILELAGYPPSIQKNPKAVFESKGYKKSLKKLLAEYKIDKQSRLKRLAQIFWSKDKRAAKKGRDSGQPRNN